MKLVRWGDAGAENPGLVDGDGEIRDLSGVVDDISPQTVTPEVLAKIRTASAADLPKAPPGVRLGSCIAQIPNFHAIGLNYYDHAEETGMEAPAEPVLFSKATTCLSGPYDDVVIPRGSEKADWEVELGFVVGTPAYHVSEADALDHVAGYCIVNDVSERGFQLGGTGQWVKGKSCPTFGPTGPWLVTTDEVADPQALGIWLELNGKRMQNGSTADMIFSVRHIVSYMSRHMLLVPGDLVCTGTPAGVGFGMKPPVLLQPGDEMRLGIDGLGEQHQKVVAYDA